MRETDPRTAAPGPLRAAVLRRLAELDLPPERAASIVDELVQHAVDAAAANGVDTDDPTALEAWLAGDEEWTELARELLHAANHASGRAARLRHGGGGPSAGLLGDAVQAARGLRAAPGFTGVAVSILALGIGLVVSAFSLIDHVLLSPLPVANEEHLVRLFSHAEDGFFGHSPLSYPELEELEDQSRTLEGTAGFALTFLALENAGGNELVLANMVTGDFFELLGVPAALGRVLAPDDDRRGDAAAVAVLSHQAWRQRFGADPAIVGRELRVNGRKLVVAGVAAEGFRGLWRGIAPTLYLPVGAALAVGAEPANSSGSSDPAADLRDERSRRWLWGLARRSAGTTHRQAAAEVETIGRALAAAYPEGDGLERKMVALPLREVTILPGLDGGIRAVAGVLFALVGLGLLLACANLANLLLARAIKRRQEVATRLSLGASRWQIARLLLLESLLLAAMGGAAGLALALASNAALNRLRLPIIVPIELHLRLDLRVAVFAVGVAVLAALMFGSAPVLEAWRTDLATALRRDSARGGSRRRRRLQAALVVAQVTLSLLLLVVAGLSLRSVLAAQRTDPGFAADGAVAATLMLELQGYDAGRTADFYRRLHEDLVALPGVESVSLPSHLPLTLWMDSWRLVPREQEHLPEREWTDVDIARVDPSYFETLGIPLVEGRSFEPGETTGERRFAVVNETLAHRFWPDQPAVGRLLSTDPEEAPYLVVGVARDGKYRTLGEDPRPFVYFPIGESWSSRTLVVRFQRQDLASTGAVGAAIHGIDRHVAISNLATLREVISPSLLLPRAGALIFGALGAIGLLLAAVGLYGVLAYAVGQRTHEIGLRVALGARRADVLRMVVRDGLRLTLLGAIFGLGASLASARLLGAVLFGVSPTDAWTFASVLSVLLLATLLASVLPARRATRIDPMRALRHD